MMSRSSLLVAVCVLPLAWAGCGRPTPQPATALPPATPLGGTLYRRVGGYDALAGVADEILRRWMGDAQLAPFFEDLSTPEKERVRQMLVDQLCAVTGGPCVYVGQDMETAHRALEISAADWDRAVTHVVGALNYFSVRPRERDELLGILGSVRDQIVTR